VDVPDLLRVLDDARGNGSDRRDDANHITMLQEPNLQVVGKLLRPELDGVCERRGIAAKGMT